MRNRLRAARWVLKEEHIEERLVFAMGNCDRDCKKGIFIVEVTFSTTKEGPTFVYRPPGTRFDHIYSAISARSGKVSALCWGCISLRGMGTIHRICWKFNQQIHQRLLERYMVLYARLLYPNGILQFQQDNIIQPAHLNWFETGLRGERISN